MECPSCQQECYRAVTIVEGSSVPVYWCCMNVECELYTENQGPVDEKKPPEGG